MSSPKRLTLNEMSNHFQANSSHSLDIHFDRRHRNGIIYNLLHEYWGSFLSAQESRKLRDAGKEMVQHGRKRQDTLRHYSSSTKFDVKIFLKHRM